MLKDRWLRFTSSMPRQLYWTLYNAGWIFGIVAAGFGLIGFILLQFYIAFKVFGIFELGFIPLVIEGIFLAGYMMAEDNVNDEKRENEKIERRLREEN